ncbi:NAD(P)H-dependent oxidoreductase [Stenotrophomonas maltophilia]|uniref:NAD(P)H-dependent oxidoreductase n=1 Tax=Stenotrophomonas riyadhensis TaxID=2859893 RepID=A0ABT2XFW0_9GAMM|nr:NADPH-dependent FMN reductase [Stenotrophomonas sp. CFS3442]MBH1618610.1 NAD(P)H-dependent oxidoreductase [Stenotrophomonas maltophilia]MCV0324828.1 NAD(P)H-dependent oxidoreductase [Stenotrophomonas sp. CFS3442]HEL4243627.1 NAD(P)H-dependent oxidoreductase [Stenotrophomonas maltophilia]
MKILAISGSLRRQSTNTALLRALQAIAPTDIELEVYTGIGDLPVFSPDLEGADEPGSVTDFKAAIAQSDGVLVCSPEYVRGIPGGLKNAIDWLVSGDQIVGRPIALVHASHRGEDMLQALRAVLSTVSAAFNAGLFLRVPVLGLEPQQVADVLRSQAHRAEADAFLAGFAGYCRSSL